MRGIFQLIRVADGVRSPAAEAERADFADALVKAPEGAIQAEDLVLVLLEKQGERWEISNAPVMRVDTFVVHFRRFEGNDNAETVSSATG